MRISQLGQLILYPFRKEFYDLGARTNKMERHPLPGLHNCISNASEMVGLIVSSQPNWERLTETADSGYSALRFMIPKSTYWTLSKWVFFQ